MNFTHIVLVGIGGMLGSIARYITVRTIDEKISSAFPFGTLAVNVIGSFVIGLLIGYVQQKSGDKTNLRLLLGTGFCGGFTTFSAFALENVSLLQQKLTGYSLLYICISLLLGLLAVWLGMIIVKSL